MGERAAIEQGRIVRAADGREALGAAIEMAFDYRGDVTVGRRSSASDVAGYVFDRKIAEAWGDSVLRMICRDDGEYLTIPYADIEHLEFSGRDTAAGKSFETWMKKYVRSKLAGETAEIQPEPLTEA
jgi:hypothetical protein